MRLTGLLSFLFIALLVVVLASFAPSASAQNPPGGDSKTIEPEKAKKVESLDQRIDTLQNTKDCIKNASNREQVNACRSNLKIRPKKDPTKNGD